MYIRLSTIISIQSKHYIANSTQTTVQMPFHNPIKLHKYKFSMFNGLFFVQALQMTINNIEIVVSLVEKYVL